MAKLSRNCHEKFNLSLRQNYKSELWHVRKIMNESFGIILMFFNFFLCMYLSTE